MNPTRHALSTLVCLPVRLVLGAICFATFLVASTAVAQDFDYIVTTVQDPVLPSEDLIFEVTVRNLTTDDRSVTLSYTKPEFVVGAGGTASLFFGTVAAGLSETLRVTLTVVGSESVPDGSVITLKLDDLARGASISHSVMVHYSLSLALALSTDKGMVAPGENFTYTLSASNLTAGSLAGTELTVEVPTGATFVSADGGGTFSSGVVSWNFGGLGVGVNKQVHVTFQAPVAGILGPTEGVLSDNSGNITRASDAQLVRAPILQYIITTAQDPVLPSEDHVFEVTVRNLTTDDRSVTLSYTKPRYVVGAGDTSSLFFGTIAAGQSETIRVSLALLSNIVVPEGAPVNLRVFDLARGATLSRSVVVRNVPSLGLALSTNQGTVAPGGNFTYTFSASNLTAGSLTGTELTVAVPAGATFVSADGGGSLSNGVVIWNLGALGVGVNKQLHTTFQAPVSGILGPLEGVLSDSAGHFTRASDAQQVRTAVLQYIITTAQDPVLPSEDLVFEVTVRNLTTSDGSVTLSYTKPRYVVGAGDTSSLFFGTIAAGQSETIRVSLTMLSNIVVPESAPINLRIFDLARGATLSRSVVARNVPALGLALSTEEGTVAPGENFTYTLAASNLTGGSLAGTVLTVPVPTGATFVSAEGGGTLSGGVVTWNLGSLGPGVNEQMNATFKAPVSGILGPLEGTLGDNGGHAARASDPKLVTAIPVIDYTLISIQNTAMPGDTIEFDMTVHNLTTSDRSVTMSYTKPRYVVGAGGTSSLFFGTVAAGQSETLKVFIDVLSVGVPSGASIDTRFFDLARGAAVSRIVPVSSAPSPTPTPTLTPSPSPSPSATPSPTPSPTPENFGNISTRLKVGTGDKVLIGGFIITGQASKKVIVRGIGPSLPVPGTLANPFLELFNINGDSVASNDDWVDSPDKQAIIDSGLAPTKDKEPAILMTLAPGLYTAVLSGSKGGSGVALVEIYDLNIAVDSKLANISTRGNVQTGDDVMIGGIIILSDHPKKIILRAIGPSLPVAGPLADPTLDLYNVDGDLIFSNDNWRDSQEDDINDTGLFPSKEKESAIVATLDPGAYTAIVRGKNDTTGVALVEAYDLE